MSKAIEHKKYTIDLDGKPYELCLGKGITSLELIKALKAKTCNKNVVLVFDDVFTDKVENQLKPDLLKEGFTVYLYAMQAGKHNKTISQAIKIFELLEANDLSRDSTLVSIGGGVIGDLAGFVASTYFRGMNLVHVPTTLTAMIDSSIGGKVAINFRKTINAIGNYYHPMLNIVDLDFIPTLPQRDFKAGLAEIIKCAIIADKDFFEFLNQNKDDILNRKDDVLLHSMSRAIEIKLDHVTGDVKEQGKRLKLNYGHTLGHAIEVSTSILEEVYRHGEGVSLGMIGAAFLGKELLNTDNKVLRSHEKILRDYELPVRVYPEEINFERKILIDECMSNVYKDKKRKDNKLRFILPENIGECKVYSDIPDELIRKAFEYVIGG